ncbi:MAG TPA: cupin domain-containing protein [Thermoanaerobaculia bacterium]|nr:cupin domain-containing protein [Thermoanaerobaculia bacterium]
MSILLREELDSTYAGTLESLIDPVSTRKFLEEHWGKSLLIVRRHSPDYYYKLFSLADVDVCLMAAAHSSGNILHVIAAQGSSRSTTLTTVSEVSKDALYSAFLSGDTLRLIGVEKFWPPVHLLTTALQQALDATAGVNFFLTPAHSQAFPLHFDNTDAFIVQLAGSKRWQIWEPTYERPLDSRLSERHVSSRMEKDETKLTLLEDFVLESGDVLYMPRGFYHKAIAIDEHSLHLTISLHPISWADFFKRAFELTALDNPELRENLPPGFVGDNRARRSMQATFSRLLERFSDTVSFEETLHSVVEDQVVARVLPPDGHFAALAGLKEIGASSRVEKRSGLACLVEESSEKAAIRFGAQGVQGPRILLPALEFIRDQQSFCASDLPGAMSLDGKVTLVRRLVREGLLKPAGL